MKIIHLSNEGTGNRKNSKISKIKSPILTIFKNRLIQMANKGPKQKSISREEILPFKGQF